MDGDDTPAVGNLPSLGNVRHDDVPRIVPKQNLVVSATAVTVPKVGRPTESAPPGAAVFADLPHRFDHQGIGTDPFLHRRQLPLLHQIGQSRRLLILAGKLLAVRDNPRPLQLPHQRTPGLCGRLSCHPAVQCQGDESQDEANQDSWLLGRERCLAHDGGSFLLARYAGISITRRPCKGHDNRLPVVTPAKAGVQRFSWGRGHWIPARAGMTMRGLNGLFS